jgi:hypothetical protein
LQRTTNSTVQLTLVAAWRHTCEAGSGPGQRCRCPLNAGPLGGFVTLQDLGSLGEFVGAIAIVVSFVYLAMQIRSNTRQVEENTRSIRVGQLDSTLQAFSRFRERLINNSEVAELWQRGLQDRSTLKGSERLRFDTLLLDLIANVQAVYLRGEITSDPFHWNNTVESVEQILKTPGARDWWSSGRSGCHEGFAEIIDQLLAVPPAAQQGVEPDVE